MTWLYIAIAILCAAALAAWLLGWLDWRRLPRMASQMHVVFRVFHLLASQHLGARLAD